MKELTFTGIGQLKWQEAPNPKLPDDAGALIEPLYVARCDLDLPLIREGLFPGPFPVGHEVVGRLVDKGDSVSKFEVDDTVVVPFQLSCGRCAECNRRSFASCRNYRAPLGSAAFGFGRAAGGHGGALADLLAVPNADHHLKHAPAGIPLTWLASAGDNLLDGYRSVAPALEQRPDAEVLVVAATPGALALYAVATARALGAPVRYVDRDPTRVDAATKLGASASVHEGPWPKRFESAPITVDVTGDAGGLSCVIRSTEAYGTCTSVAIDFAPMTPVPMLEMYTRGITLHTSRADSLRFLPDVLALLSGGSLNLDQIPTTTCNWDDAAEAWLEPATKLVVCRDSDT